MSPPHLEARLQLGSACKKGDLLCRYSNCWMAARLPSTRRCDGCLCATADSAHPRSAGWPSNVGSAQGYVDTAPVIGATVVRGQGTHAATRRWSRPACGLLRFGRLLIARGAPQSTPGKDRLPGTIYRARDRHSSKCVGPLPKFRRCAGRLGAAFADHGADVHLTSYRNQTPLTEACDLAQVVAELRERKVRQARELRQLDALLRARRAVEVERRVRVLSLRGTSTGGAAKRVDSLAASAATA